MQKKEKTYYIVAVIVFIIGIYLLVWNATKHSPYGDFYSFIGGIIGGIATLLAVVLSIIETRKVQNQNLEVSNKNLQIQILNEKISDYNELYKSLNALIKFYTKFSSMYDEIRSNNISSDRCIEILNSFDEQITEARLRCNCIESSSIYTQINDLLFRSIDIVELIKAAVERRMTEEVKNDINKERLKPLIEWRSKLTVLSVQINFLINGYYKEKYNLANKENPK